MSLPQPGQLAPDFELPADNGETIRLAALRGQTVVLFFYPKADTPGCIKEVCSFRDSYTDFQAQNTVVLGLSPDEVKDEAHFKQKFNLPYPLLADSDHAVAEAYGVWGEKVFMGRNYMGVLRTTFIIDKNGQVARVFENVKPVGHGPAVLQALAEIG